MKVIIDKQSINYSMGGSKGRTVNVFLHGWQGTAKSWVNTTSRFPSDGAWLVVDLPGFGQSPAPQDGIWSIEQYADFLFRFLSILKIEQVNIIGKSFGGRVATVFASKHPEYVQKLVLVSSAGVERRNILIWLEILGSKVVGKAMLSLPKPLADKVRLYLLNKFHIQKDVDDYKWKLKKVVTNEDLSGYAKTIRVPTLIIWGGRDKVLPLSVGKRLNGYIKQSELIVFPDGGHDLYTDMYPEFNRTIYEFLKLGP